MIRRHFDTIGSAARHLIEEGFRFVGPSSRWRKVDVGRDLIVQADILLWGSRAVIVFRRRDTRGRLLV
jgi:hypothetical protein